MERAFAAGKDLLLDIDVQGARQLRKALPRGAAVSIFILAPSRQELEQRLRARGEDSESVIERRLSDAAREIRDYGQYDYVLVNREVEESVETLKSILRAERVRRARMESEIQPILESFEQESSIRRSLEK
jgi:guanylate kinase